VPYLERDTALLYLRDEYLHNAASLNYPPEEVPVIEQVPFREKRAGMLVRDQLLPEVLPIVLLPHVP
jgi:hypothetical protein